MTRPQRLRVALVLLLAASALVVRPIAAADSLPGALSGADFWRLIETLSETGGQFQSDNLLSNETGFQGVLPGLTKTVAPGGVYMGVGPEQNFTYIAALKPKMAFITDIRRQNMVEHLLYQALFQSSADRVEFVSRLFSRPRPAGLSAASSVDELFAAFGPVTPDASLFSRNMADVRASFVAQGYQLTEEDQAGLERVYAAFRDAGPGLSYNFNTGGGGRRGGGMPTYADLMTSRDPEGQARSYLASEANYAFLRDMETRRLIVPITGDFGGPKALRAVGQYVRDHQAIVTAFYTSNVEQYLFQGADSRGNVNGGGENFYANVATLPLDPSSMFIRSGNAGGRGLNVGRGFVGGLGRMNVFASIQETLAAVKDGRVRTYGDLFLLSR
jgi:hypothetical protein